MPLRVVCLLVSATGSRRASRSPSGSTGSCLGERSTTSLRGGSTIPSGSAGSSGRAVLGMPKPADPRRIADAASIRHTGFGDCACAECPPVEPLPPLADHGKPLGLLRSLWVVLRGVRFYA